MAENKNKGFSAQIVQYIKDFKLIADNPIAYWGVQTVNFLDSLAYFMFFNMIIVFLTDNLGWNDVNAGYVFSTFTILTTVSLFVSGFVTDALGIKKSLYISMGMALAARGGLAFCGLVEFPYREWVAVPLLIIAAPSMAMTQTVFQSANRRYSTARSRSASFNLWYLIMNIGAAGAGFGIDLIRKTLGMDNSWIFAFAAFTCVLSTIITFLMVKTEEQVVGQDEKTVKKEEKEDKLDGFKRIKELVGQSAFWRFMVLCVAVLGVRAVFLYFGMIMPKYWLRVIGPDAPIGMFQSINPIVVVVGLVILLPLTGRFNVFKMLVFGAVISSLSLLILVMPWGWFDSEVASAYLRMSIVMAIVLAIGEIIWSPRLQEYTAAIAPKGMEGAYLGMSMVPYFFAKLVVSGLSGHMLERWCPQPPEGEPLWFQQKIVNGALGFWNSPEAMWLVLFAWAIAGVVIAMIFRKWLTAGTDLDPASKKTAA